MSVASFLLNSAHRTLWNWRNRDQWVRSSAASKPRLLVDVSAILRHDAQTGIQRVVRAVWSELVKRQGPSFELIPVFASHRHGYCYAPFDFLDREAPVRSHEPVSAGPDDKFFGLDLSAHFLPRHQRQLTRWRTAGATIHIVVYDLLPLSRPEWFSAPLVKNFRRWFRFLARHTDQAICISRQVGRDLREQLRSAGGGSSLVIGYMELGGDIAASRPSRGGCTNVGALLDRMRFRPSILMVGTLEPRKGYAEALAAFEHLWAQGRKDAPDLIIVGKPGWKTQQLQQRIRDHSEQGNRLHWLDRVSDEDLCRLYEASRGLLMATHGEGMGLPLLEAALHQRHVLARDLPVFHEQPVRGMMFFEDDRPEVLARHVLDLAARGVERAPVSTNLPNWSQSVDKLLQELGFEAAVAAPEAVALSL